MTKGSRRHIRGRAPRLVLPAGPVFATPPALSLGDVPFNVRKAQSLFAFPSSRNCFFVSLGVMSNIHLMFLTNGPQAQDVFALRAEATGRVVGELQ